MITTDVNSKSAMWHRNSTDKRREEEELVIAEKGLMVVNSNPPTYKGRVEVHSNIDITLVSGGSCSHLVFIT